MSGSRHLPINGEYGPFHRLESATQSKEVAANQEATRRLGGRPARSSSIPAVKAWRGPLRSGDRGVEFFTTVEPHRTAHPNWVFWYETTPGVTVEIPGDYVSIPVRLTRNTQV